jgi:hypothetical protein
MLGVGAFEASGVEAEVLTGLEGVGVWDDGTCATGMAAVTVRRAEDAKRVVKRIFVTCLLTRCKGYEANVEGLSSRRPNSNIIQKD